MEIKKRQPIGIELVKRGLVTETDIQKALEYQKEYPKKRIGDILYVLDLCDPNQLLEAIGDILAEKTILLKQEDITIRMDEYISQDLAKQNKAIPFSVGGRKNKGMFC